MATPISPKVTASALSGIIATTLLANITLITPDLFSGLGKWGPLVYGLVITVAVAVAGFLKNDPLRVVPADTTTPATVNNVAAPTTFAPTQAKLDAVTVTAPEPTAPTAPPVITPVYNPVTPEPAPAAPVA